MSKPTPSGWLQEMLDPGSTQRERDRMQVLLDAAPVDATPRRISAPASGCSGHVRADHVGDVNKMVRPCRCGLGANENE
jgi:hypothetical protein